MLHQNNGAKTRCMIAASNYALTLQNAACTHHINSTLTLSQNVRAISLLAGVSVGIRPEEAGAWMTSLLGLLPSPVGPSAKAPPPDSPEALQYIAVLQCLQRLVSAPALASAMLNTIGHTSPTSAAVLHESPCTSVQPSWLARDIHLPPPPPLLTTIAWTGVWVLAP